MKRILLLLAALLALPTIAAEKPCRDCPQPKVVIRGPCPDPCKPCPGCPKCPDCNPPPSVVAPVSLSCPPCDPKTVIKYRDEPASSLVGAQAGHWFVPVSLLWLPGGTDRASWRVARDPSLEIKHDSTFAVGAGIGHRWANGYALSGSIYRLLSEDSSVKFTSNPYRYRNLDISTERDDWAFGATLEIPIR